MYYKSSEEETIKPHREGFSHSPFSSLSNHNVALRFDLDHVRWAIKDDRLAILNPNFPLTSHRLMRNLLPQLHSTHPRFPSSMFSPSRFLLFWTFLQLSSQILALTIGGSCCPAGLKTLHVPESTFQVGLKKQKQRIGLLERINGNYFGNLLPLPAHLKTESKKVTSPGQNYQVD